ncbi:MAG: hypothetical protein C0446_11225 [Chitinophaga sp.]|nr:hypothetical protein [Chitinophaga sp.]
MVSIKYRVCPIRYGFGLHNFEVHQLHQKAVDQHTFPKVFTVAEYFFKHLDNMQVFQKLVSSVIVDLY